MTIRFKNKSELLRDHMIAPFLGSVFSDFFPETNQKQTFVPRADILERADRFELNIALPGMKKEDIAIEMKNDELHLSGERKLPAENKEEATYRLVENRYGHFSRSFSLPETVSREGIEASFTDGILVIKLPKSEKKDNSQKIEVK